MKTKELTNVPGLEPTDIVVIKKLGYGSLNKLRGNTTNTNINTQTQKMDVNMNLGEYMKWLVVFGIHKAPFFDKCKDENDKARVIDNDEIEANTGEYIYKEIEAFNGFAGVDEVKKN